MALKSCWFKVLILCVCVCVCACEIDRFSLEGKMQEKKAAGWGLGGSRVLLLCACACVRVCACNKSHFPAET